MSIIERLKDRKLFSPSVEVPISETDPEFVFEIGRMPRAEVDCAVISALDMLSPLGGQVDDGVRNATFVFAFASYLKRHIKGWKHTPADGGEQLVFSRSNLDQLFSILSIKELSAIVAGYNTATAADEKKTLPSETSAPV